jgi:prepilin peptidase dependent protein D
MRFNVGFSAIELLITFALLAIVSAIGVPTYAKYQTRVKMANILKEVNAAQMIVINDYHNNKTFNDSNYTNGDYNFTNSQANYISSIDIVDGIITINGEPTELGSRTITLTLTPNVNNNDITWSCAVNDAAFNEYVAKECRI